MITAKLQRLPNALLALSVLAFGLAPAVRAQAVSNASITGRISDEQGSLLPGAHVKLLGVENGSIQNAVLYRQ